MIVTINNEKKLREIQSQTGKSVSEIVEEILAVHLDEDKKAEFVIQELEDVFSEMKSKYGIKD